MKKVRFIANRQYIEEKIDCIYPLMKLVKGYSYIANKVNARLKKEGSTKKTTTDEVYRCINKKHLVDEYIPLIIIEETFLFFKQIKKAIPTEALDKG